MVHRLINNESNYTPERVLSSGSCSVSLCVVFLSYFISVFSGLLSFCFRWIRDAVWTVWTRSSRIWTEVSQKISSSVSSGWLATHTCTQGFLSIFPKTLRAGCTNWRWAQVRCGFTHFAMAVCGVFSYWLTETATHYVVISWTDPGPEPFLL